MKRSVHFLYGIAGGSADPKSVIDKMARVGAESVELPVEPFICDNGEYLAEVKKYADDAGVEIIFSTGFPKQCDMASNDAQIRSAGQKHMKKILSVMDKGGIDFMGGTLCTCWPSYRSSVLTPEDKKIITERTAECFADAISDAPDMGIVLAIEPVNRFEGFLLNTAAEGVDFCKLVGNPNLGVMLDGFHMSVEENSIADAVIGAGKYLKHLHCAENNRRLPGTGEFPWERFFRALKDIDYSGRLGIEAFTVAGGDVSASVALWRDLSDGADEAGLEAQLKSSLEFLAAQAKAVCL